MTDWQTKQRQDIKSKLDNLLFKASSVERIRIRAGQSWIEGQEDKSWLTYRELEDKLDKAQQEFLQMVYKKIESLEKQGLRL